MFVQFIQNVPGANPALTLRGPWSSVLYVDQVRGNDVTGTRGDDNLPFATIQAAINAALTDDTVLLSGQRFALTAALTIPSSVVRLTLMGSVPNAANNAGASATRPGTSILGANIDRIDLGANPGLTQFNLTDIAFSTATAGFYSIKADGTTTDLTGPTIYVNDCQGINTYAKRVAGVSFWGTVGAAANSFIGCAFVTLYSNTQFVFDTLISYDNSVDPFVGFGGVVTLLNGSVLGQNSAGNKITHTGQAKIVVDQTSTIMGLFGAGLLAPAGGHAPSVVCSGYINAGGINYATAGAELPDTATALVFDFTGSRLVAVNGAAPGGATFVKFKVAGAAVNVQVVTMSDTTTIPSCAITADAGINLVGRGGRWPQATLSTPAGTGTIIPPPFTTGPTALASTAQAVAFGFRMGTTAYTVSPDMDDSTALYLSVTGRLATGFTVNCVVAAGNFRSVVTPL
jgi:hypothetical protein